MYVKRKVWLPAQMANGYPVAARDAVFAKTNVPNLYRHRNGIYYSRITLDGQRQFRSLGTKLKSVADSELKKHEQLSHGQRLAATLTVSGATLRTFGDCLRLYKQRIVERPNQQPSTVTYKLSGIKVLEKTWSLMMTLPRDITLDAVWRWLNIMENRADFKPPGAKKSSCKNAVKISNSSYNRNLLALRGVLDFAVEHGLCVRNVARDKSVRQRKYVPKVPALPSAEQFRMLVAHLKKSPLTVHREARFLIEFCAYTGARLGTAQAVTWGCVKPDGIVFKKLKGAADREPTFVPLNVSAKNLLAEIRRARGTVADDERILKIRECQRTLTAVFPR